MISYSQSLLKQKQKSKKDSNHTSTEDFVSITPILFHAGNPYAKSEKESRLTGKNRKYHTSIGWVTINDVVSCTGYNESKVRRLLRYKTMDQIIRMGQ